MLIPNRYQKVVVKPSYLMYNICIEIEERNMNFGTEIAGFLFNFMICLIITFNWPHDNPVMTVLAGVGACMLIQTVFRVVHLALFQNRNA